VTLTGKVYWLFQSQDAERVVHHIRGIKEVQNYITVVPLGVVNDVRDRIVAALYRNANIDAEHIMVTVTGNTAVLAGTVGTCFQREAAEDAAAEAPGIARVDNRLVVEPPTAVDELC
jgi:osmotically-inducible protein OsmY